MIPAGQVPLFRDILFGGRYNLLLGAGISRDSKNRAGQQVKDTDQLRRELCELKELSPNSSLARATSYLTPDETQRLITSQFEGCKAGATARSIPRFVWSQVFTLNVDDALEDAYAFHESRRQSPLPVNYTRPFESFRHRAEVPIVHLHGFVRDPSAPYVFSFRDYARATRELNPWMHLLSDLLRSEPFIIAGTSLTEPDLEYYLSKRAEGIFSGSRELSILIEPNPDAGTRKDCERFGLLLVQAALVDFLSWVEKELGPSPTVRDIVAPVQTPTYKRTPDQYSEVTFFSEFELVVPEIASQPSVGRVPAFYFGRPPSWADLKSKRDVVLKDQLTVLDTVRTWLGAAEESRVIVCEGLAGSGKTTTLKRIALDLAALGNVVFFLKTKDGVDVDAAASLLRDVKGLPVLCVDNLAERADNIVHLLEKVGATTPVLVLGVERAYRHEHLETVLGELQPTNLTLGTWALDERIRLIENYRELGLVGNPEAVKQPRQFAREIGEDTVAESICKILNDFRPLRNIVASLWNDAAPDIRDAYLALALAHYCQPQGLRMSILAGTTNNITLADLQAEGCPLPATTSPEDETFVLPLNATIANQLVALAAAEKPAKLLDAFVRLANVLAPYVTRRTIMQQTAEARLAGRLFDADKVVKPLLKDLSEAFYDACRDRWQWNSRYWEQRALAIAAQDLRVAIQHARHAVAIERHPFGLTTLANLLFQEMREVRDASTQRRFDEAFELIQAAIEREAVSGRPRTKHAFFVLLRGAKAFLEMGNALSRRQLEFVRATCSDVEASFSRARELALLASEVRAMISK